MDADIATCQENTFHALCWQLQCGLYDQVPLKMRDQSMHCYHKQSLSKLCSESGNVTEGSCHLILYVYAGGNRCGSLHQ
jgi:hypothetical protein